jgi:acyl-CoA synthetase (AMP-forming)/AMP-acid ligase II
MDYEALKQEIVSQAIQVISMPFSALNAFCLSIGIENLEDHNIKYIVSTAEQLYINEGLKTFLEKNPKTELHNHYGPSESHVVTSYKMSAELNNMESKALIGKPLSNCQIYILDQHKKLVPQGIEGELYIGGDNLATGYLNKETLTKERFVDNLFGSGKLYKTGDQCRWLADGNIEFMGRNDDQVKIRGYRIELGEIEHALKTHQDIEEAVVLTKENKNKEKGLAAYITSKKEQNTADLRSYLKTILPEYMLPEYYVQMESMPLTSNGKIDKKALPDPEGMGLASGVEYLAPRNEIEKRVIEVWEIVLGKKNIGVNDDFFALGGNSFRVMGLIAEYNASFNVRLSLQDLFDKTQLYLHAELIEIRHWVGNESEAEVSEKENIETFEF